MKHQFLPRSRKRLAMYFVLGMLLVMSYFSTPMTSLSSSVRGSTVEQAFMESYLKQEQPPRQQQQPEAQARPTPQKRRMPPQPPIRLNQLPIIHHDKVPHNILNRLPLEKLVRIPNNNNNNNYHNNTASSLSPLSSSNLPTNTSEKIPLYIQQHCNLSGVPNWMPPSHDDWRRRTPRFLILGAKKGGTTGVFASLVAHPHVLRGRLKELLYFVPVRFPHWANDRIGQPVQVGPARQQLWQKYLAKDKIRKLPRAMTGEATPDYLFYSKYSAQAIMCSVPWAKMIVLLREPIDRMFSHYNFIRDPHRTNRPLPPFEAWIRTDIRRLQSAGVLPRNLSDIPQYMQSEQERQGWERYQLDFGKHLMDRPVARSLYAIQLEQWLEAFAQIGKNPATDLKVILSEDIKRNATVTQELLEWLGVASTVRVPPKQVKQAMVTTYTSSSIPPDFQQWLTDTIFVHYNRRLYKLLGPRFEGVFDLPLTDSTAPTAK